MTPAVHPCICRNTARKEDVTTRLQSNPCCLLLTRQKLLRTTFRCGINAALDCCFLCLQDAWEHLDLAQHGAQQCLLWSQAAILPPESFSLCISQQLPAGKWEGMEIQSLPKARRKEHKGGKGREQMPSMSPHGSSPMCRDEPPQHMLHSCSQGSSRGKPNSPTNTLHSGLPRSWRFVSNRCQQARLAKQDPSSAEERLIFAFWSQKFWVSHNCLARELTLTSDKW